MSEFSESYHLRSERSEDAVELLRSVHRRGYVYPPSNGWVTFVVAGRTFEPDEELVSAATQPLLYYQFAEDHGWGFALFERGTPVSHYSCYWDEDDLEVEAAQYSRQALEQRIPVLDAALLDVVEGWLDPQDIDELLEAEPAKLFAQALGLEHYNWLSFDYVAQDSEGGSDLIEVT
ncbi:hypothetical protein RYO59_000747 [Thermosynechococcaceae cyanobacterium Okahandja]